MADKSNVVTLVEALEQNPCTNVLLKELEDCILKFGSYASILKNKQLNQVALVVEILQDVNLQDELCVYLSCDSFRVALSLLFTHNPHLAKSKAIRDKIKYWKENGSYKKPAKHI